MSVKTTLEIDPELLREAASLYRFKTKTATVEAGLRELINAHKRKQLANLFGAQKDIKLIPRRR